jgi:hypothetical protein
MRSTMARCAIAVWDQAACARSRPLSAGGARWGFQGCWQLTGASPLKRLAAVCADGVRTWPDIRCVKG